MNSHAVSKISGARLLFVVAMIVGLLVAIPGAQADSVVPVANLQPSWTAAGGGGVFAAYIGPPDYGYVSPGTTAVYDGREAGIIKAGLTVDPTSGNYEDEGILAFKVNNVAIASFALQALSYDVQNETGTNPVWVRIRVVGGTTYQFVPTTNPTSWHTVDAAAGQWQLMDGNGNGTGPLMTLGQLAAASPTLVVDRVYLTLGMGNSYNVSPGVGTVGWVDKVTIDVVTHDFVVMSPCTTDCYVDAATGDDAGPGTADWPKKTIQAAVSTVSSGGTVHVAAGTYTAGANLNKPLTLSGAQASVDARDGRPGASESVITAGGLGTFSLNATDITFDGFKFTDIKGRTIDTYYDADNFTMRNCILQSPSIDPGYNTGAIQFGGGLSLHANGLLFEQNLVTADNGQLFYMGHAMDNGTFRNNLFNGDSVSFGPFGERTGWVIEGNEFNGNVGAHGPYWGFGFNANLGNVIIRNNYVHQMQVGIGQISVVNGLITGNNFFDNSYGAFQLWGDEWGAVVSTNALIENNWIKYNGMAYDNAATFPAHGLRLRLHADASTIHLHENFFENLGVGAAGGVWAIRQGGIGSADAEQNWWGTTDPAVIATMIGEGAADFEPWIVSYVDDPAKAGQRGFWPISIVPGYPPCTTDCYVDATTGNDANPGTLALPMKTIGAAVAVVAPGGTVHVAAGAYPEDVNVNKQLTILGAGSGIGGTIVTGGGGGAGGRGGIIQLSASGLSASQPILLQALRIQPTGQAGISVGLFTQATGTNVSYVELNDVKVVGTNTSPCTEQERGLYVDLTSSLTNLKITNSAFNNLHYGWYIQKQVSADTSTVQYVTVSNTTFNHNNEKGIYAEKLEDASFTGVTVDQNGYDASLLSDCSYFAPWMSGVDINLKAGTYQNLTFTDSVVTANGLGGAKEGVGLAFKARDDGSTYGSFPATLDDVLFDGGQVTGNERGIRVGEPGKNNAGPTNVVVQDACISGNVKTYLGTDGSAYGGLVNVSQATVDARLNWWGAASGPYHATLNSTGAGNAVSDGIDFVPWVTDGCGGTALSTTLSASTNDALFCTGDTTIVVIDLAGVADLYGYQFQVSYDHTKASVVGAFVNSFFDTADPASKPWNATCAAGVCKFAVSHTSKTAQQAVSGSGPLAQITLTGVAPGSFSMAISDDVLSDIDGAPLDHTLGAALPLPISICGYATISGYITMQGRFTGNVDTGTVSMIEQTTANFGTFGPAIFAIANGAYSIQVPFMLGGTSYKIVADNELYLANQDTITVSANLANKNTRLWGGDANNDSNVTITDLSCVGASFGEAPPGTCAGGSADINADGRVNIQDLSITGGNFDKCGAQPWAWQTASPVICAP